MPPLSIPTVLQVVLALGLLNVWVLRASSPTRYRGGQAQSLREEFRTYHLPTWFFLLVGTLKVGSAILLLVGLWVPSLVLPAATVIVVLMLGALAMHAKVHDPSHKSVPALVMLVMSATLCLYHLP